MHVTAVDALAREIALLARPLLLALDVDGTLAPIVDDPTRAKVPPETAARLAALSARGDVTVALVTGRDAAQLDRMITLDRAWRIVEHGLAILAPGEHAPAIDPSMRERLARVRAWAIASAAPRGARVEEKASSIVVHVRELMARDRAESDAILREAREVAAREGLFAREGRAVVEVQAQRVDKGSALAALIERLGAASVVYAGDDRTDEPAIALASTRGIGVFVRSSERPDPPFGAKAVLDGPDDVARVLDVLATAL